MTTTAVPPPPAMPSGSPVLQVDVLFLDSPHGRPDPARWSDDRLAAELVAVQRRRAADTAYEATLILAMAAARPAGADPQPGSPGSRSRGWATGRAAGDDGSGISEFFPAELSAVLNLGRGTASFRLGRAMTWRDKLPATFAALAAGDLDERRATELADALAHTPPEVARQVEAALLPEANDLSVYKLRDRATELVLALDPASAEDARAEAEKSADVRLYPSAGDGRSTLAADLPTDEAVECHDLLDQLARMLKADGDPRPIGALRAHVLSALIRRPADNGLPAVRANLTVTAAVDALAGTSSTAGEVNGLPITAAHLRELLARLGALGLTSPDGGSLIYALTGPDGQLLATLTPTELTRLARRCCTDHPGADASSGGSGGDVADGCSWPVTAPPPATNNYEPTDRQRAFVTTRDRRCRFPNCGQRVGWADLDHVIPHACGGATDCTNLCCLCRSHHRLKTFAPGWRFEMTSSGSLTVTTPSGVTRTTRPPGMRLRPPGGARAPVEGEPPPNTPPPGDDPPLF